MKFENIKLDKSDHAKVDNNASVARNVIRVIGIGIGIAAVEIISNFLEKSQRSYKAGKCE